MRIQVSGKQIDIGDALRSHVEERLDEVVGKYFDRPVEAVVTFSATATSSCADSSVHLSTGMTVQAKAAGRRDLRLLSKARWTGWRSSCAATSAG